MSVTSRQRTCAGCGKPIGPDENVNVEPLVDNNIRYVVTHWGCCTFIHHEDAHDQPSIDLKPGLTDHEP